MLLKVLGLAMRGQSLRVAVLLIDDHGVGVVLELVGNIADASRFLTRSSSQQTQGLGNIGAIFSGELQADGKTNQGRLLLAGDDSPRALFFQSTCGCYRVRRQTREAPWSGPGLGRWKPFLFLLRSPAPGSAGTRARPGAAFRTP